MLAVSIKLMEQRRDQPPPSGREVRRKQLLDTVRNSYWAALAYGAGGVGVALTGVIPEPRYNPEMTVFMLIKVASYISMVSGGFIGLTSLSDMADFARTHIHARISEVSPAPIVQPQPVVEIAPKPPTPEEIRARKAIKIITDLGIKEDYRRGLDELGIPTRRRNALLVNAKPYNRVPMSVAGLRLFLQLEIPIQGRNIGNGTRAVIAASVAPITYPESIEDHQRLTQTERDQMVQNEYTERF